MSVRYPTVQVELVGTDGNVFSLIGRTSKAIRKVHGSEAANDFAKEAFTCGSYDEVLVLIQSTVNVE